MCYFVLQLAPLKDKSESSVLHILVVTKHVIVLILQSAHRSVLLMDVNVQLEQLLTGRNVNVYVQINVKVKRMVKSFMMQLYIMISAP